MRKMISIVSMVLLFGLMNGAISSANDESGRNYMQLERGITKREFIRRMLPRGSSEETTPTPSATCTGSSWSYPRALADVPSSGYSGTITLTIPSGCQWVLGAFDPITEELVDWVLVNGAKAATGYGNSDVSISVTSNTGASRDAELWVFVDPYGETLGAHTTIHQREVGTTTTTIPTTTTTTIFPTTTTTTYATTTSTTIRPTTTTTTTIWPTTTTSVRPTTSSTTSIPPSGGSTKKLVWVKHSTAEVEIWTLDQIGEVIGKNKIEPPKRISKMKAFHANNDGTYTLLWHVDTNGNCEAWTLDQNDVVLYKMFYKSNTGWAPEAYEE